MEKQNQELSWHHPGGKLVELGADKLSDAELLSILIGTGIKGKSAEQIANEIIRRFGSFKGLIGQPLEIFLEFKGLGDAKIIRIAAAYELARRMAEKTIEELEPDKKVVPKNGNEDVIAWNNKLYRAITACYMLPEQMEDWLNENGAQIHKISADEKLVPGFKKRDSYIYCNGRLYRALNDEIKSYDEITEWSWSPEGKKFILELEEYLQKNQENETKNKK